MPEYEFSLNRTFPHCVESVPIRSFFWSVSSCIQSEFRKIQARKKSGYGHFSGSAVLGQNLRFWIRENTYFGIFYAAIRNTCVTTSKRTLRKKCLYLELFWSIFSCIRTEQGEVRIWSKCGKIRTRLNPNTDTFSRSGNERPSLFKKYKCLNYASLHLFKTI